MELKKAMQRKTNILQLVSICLGAVLALSMVFFPVNAAFADDMQDRVTACEELAIPKDVKEILNYFCPGPECEDVKESFIGVPGVEKYVDNLLLPQYVKDELNYYCPDIDCEYAKQRYGKFPGVENYIKDLPAIPYNVNQELNYFCPGRECEKVKQRYIAEFPAFETYIEELAIPQNVKDELNYFCPGPDCEYAKQRYIGEFPAVEKYIEELPAIPPDVKQQLNYYCPGTECEDVKQSYIGFPDVEKYIEYQCEELEAKPEIKSPEIKSEGIKTGDSCNGEVSNSHGGDYTGYWRIVKDGGCGQEDNAVKICDRKKGTGNVEGSVEVEEGSCCYAKWSGGQSYIGSIFYDETSKTFGCDSY
ncbi:MAG: hypothetical protein F6J93_37170 [Oscillatoria sp. SIO1A7]|nr:hypothetical protein [Oscillatoria sp. SIO1A7]